ncbi:MAG: arsenite methyltransferase [Anaerolineae bacterium]
MDKDVTAEQIKEVVRDAYGQIARRFIEEPQAPKQTCCCSSSAKVSCCSPSTAPAAQPAAASRFYTTEDLSNLPESVTEASLGCGNPLALAGLQPGEVVLDLGSGGGIDCFLAAREVGPEGRVIGLDMTPEMIELAWRNALELGVTNVDFCFGQMENIPLPDEAVDVVISNCVINLSSDKDAVFREAYRVLRPGGRLSISDIVVDGDLPQSIRRRLDAWTACIAGALEESVYLAKIWAAGFEQVEVLSRQGNVVDGSIEWDESPATGESDTDRYVGEYPARSTLGHNEWESKVMSIKVLAYKPA